MSSKDAVCLRGLEAVRAEKTIHAVYFSAGASQQAAYIRLIALHGVGITNIAKVSSEDGDQLELARKYTAADQTIIIFSRDATELVRFTPASTDSAIAQWIATQNPRTQVAQK